MSDVCDWCDGQGCDECDFKGRTGTDPQAAPQTSMCDHCDGKGCDSCQNNADAGQSTGPCDWCDGEGCDECGNQPYRKPVASATATTNASTAAPPPPCEWCDGEGCDECGNVAHSSATSGAWGAADASGGTAGGWGDVDVGWSTDLDTALSPSERLTNAFYAVEYESDKQLKMRGLRRVLDIEQAHVGELDREARSHATRALTMLCTLALEMGDSEQALGLLDRLLEGDPAPSVLRSVLAAATQAGRAEEACVCVMQSGKTWALHSARVPVAVSALQAIELARAQPSEANNARAEATTAAALALLPQETVERVRVGVLSAVLAADPYRSAEGAWRSQAGSAGAVDQRERMQARVLQLVLHLSLSELQGNPDRALAVELERVLDGDEATVLESDADAGKLSVTAWMVVGALRVEQQQWRSAYLAYYRAFTLASKVAGDMVNRALAMAVVCTAASAGADVTESAEARGVVAQASSGSLLDCAVWCARAAAAGDMVEMREHIAAWERACAAHGERAGRRSVSGLWGACLAEDVRHSVRGRSCAMLGEVVQRYEPFLPRATIDSVLTCTALALPGASLDLASLCLTVPASLNAHAPLTDTQDMGALPLTTRRAENDSVRPHGLQSVHAFPLLAMESGASLLRVKDAGSSAEAATRAKAAAAGDIVAVTAKMVAGMML